MPNKKADIIFLTALILLAIWGFFNWKSEKFGAVLTEVPRFYEDKSENLCYWVEADGTKKMMKTEDYPPNLKHNGDWAYCTYPVKQIILKDNEYYRLPGYSSSTKPVFLKEVGQNPATTTLQ